MWDIDGNDYVDLHNGYGVMVMGHAHPKIVEAVKRRVERGTHFAQPTEEALPVAENLAERYHLPQWRFGNSGTEATLDACRISRALTGRKKILKIEGTYHGHHDSLMVSVFPDEAKAGPRDHPVAVPQTLGLPEEFVDLVQNVPFNDLDAATKSFAEHPGEFACMIVEPAMTNCGLVLARPRLPRGSEGALPCRRRAVRLRRGEDRLHPRLGRRDRGVRRRARPRLLGEGARRRPAVRGDRRHRGSDGHGDHAASSTSKEPSTGTRSRWRPPRRTSST